MLRIIIAGGRDFNDYKTLCGVCDYMFQKQKEIEIVSGTANGADKLGEQYANEMGYPIKQFPADWDKHGKKAGYLRNKEMAEYADALLALWDGKSKGTKSMIDLAKKNNLKVRVVRYNPFLGITPE